MALKLTRRIFGCSRCALAIMKTPCSLAWALDRNTVCRHSRSVVTRRTLQVVVVLIALGAGAGALCGALAVIPLAIQHAFWPTRDDGLIGSATSWLPVTMGIGATVGGVLGPIASFTLLRSIPLGRILVTLTSAAVLGVFASWALFRVTALPSSLRAFAPLWLPAASALTAAIGLRSRLRPNRAVGDPTPSSPARN